MTKFQCNVTSCVRKIIGAKNSSSFLIERTCRYAKSGECILGHIKHVEKHNNTVIPNNYLYSKSMFNKGN